MTIHWKAVEQYFTVVLFGFNFPQFVILENLSVLDLALAVSERVYNNTVSPLLERRANARNVSTSLLPYSGLTYLINSLDYLNLLLFTKSFLKSTGEWWCFSMKHVWRV